MWDFANDIVEENMTLWAAWERGVIVAFDPDDGSGYEKFYKATLTKGSKVTDKPEDPQRAGYFFKGWYSYLDEHGEPVLWDFANDTVEENMTLWAAWDEVFTVLFHPNDGHEYDYNQLEKILVKSGDKITSKPVPPERPGYIFAGWTTHGDNELAEQRIYWDFEIHSVEHNMELYAAWDKEEGNPDKPDGGGTDKPDGGGTDKPDGGGTDKPDGGGTDKPDGGGTDKPDGGGTDKPDGGGTDKPDGGGTDKPDGGGTDKPDGSETDKPDGGGTDKSDGGGTDKPDGGGTDKPDGGGTDKSDGGGTDKPDGGGTDKPDGGGTDKSDGGGTDKPDGGGTDKPAIDQLDDLPQTGESIDWVYVYLLLGSLSLIGLASLRISHLKQVS